MNHDTDIDKCLICLENIDTENTSFPKHCNCKVKIHLQCLNLLMNSGLLCPICRIKKHDNYEIINHLNHDNHEIINYINHDPQILMFPINLFLRYPGFWTFIIYIIFSFIITFFYVLPMVIIYGLCDEVYRKNILAILLLIIGGIITCILIL